MYCGMSRVKNQLSGKRSIVNEPFNLLFCRYQIGFDEAMQDSEFVFDYLNRLLYKYNKVSSNRGGSHIDFPE